jgi:hypothetical protein
MLYEHVANPFCAPQLNAKEYLVSQDDIAAPANCLDAELMIIGQDWGGEDLYVTYQGIGNDENATNKTIRDLLDCLAIVSMGQYVPP